MLVNHCHVFPEGTLNKQHPELGTLPMLESFMEECGIEKAVAFSPARRWMPRDTFYDLKVQNPHEWLHESIKDRDDIYGVMALEPKDGDACRVVEEYAAKGFVGIKIHPCCSAVRIDDPAFKEIYATAERLGLFVVFHTAVHGWRLQDYRPILIDNVACDHPGLNIIIEHMGYPDFVDEAIAVLRNHSSNWNTPNVYAGFAGFVREEYREYIMRIVEEIGADRIVYGIDFPRCTPAPDFPENTQPFPPERSSQIFRQSIDLLTSWGVSGKDMENIMGGTLQRLIRQ